MKQAILYLSLILFSVCAAGQPVKERPVLSSVFTDNWQGMGNNAKLWQTAEPVFFAKPSVSDNKVGVRSLWSSDSLYLLFEVEDKELRAYQQEKDHPALYLDDMVEVLIDAFNDKDDCWATDDIVYHINLQGQKKDDRGTKNCTSDSTWDGKANYAVTLSGTLNDPSDTDQGYQVEIALPWRELQVSPEAEKKIGINFAIGDNDGNGRQLFSWSEVWPMRTPSGFGTLVLKESLPQKETWAGFGKDSIISPMDKYVNRFHYYKSTASGKMPLLVSIHQWSADYTNFRNSMAEQAKAENWNYIFPDVRGANNHPKACGSDYVIADIDQTIEWAVKHLSVDTSRIYIVGASGGGYHALCHFMKSRYPVKAYSVWVPITDLNSWYHESLSRKNKYAQDIEKCICNDCPEFRKEMAEARSPLYWQTPKDKLTSTTIHIYAGIHDGYTGAVPITHSIRFYNKVINDIGIEDNGHISRDETEWMLTTRKAPYFSRHKIGERDVLYSKNTGNISLTLFEGGHEILADEVIGQLKDNSTWLWDMAVLRDVKKNRDTPAYKKAYQSLIEEAESKLLEKPYSVTYKKKKAPSGDKHDYVSLSRYRWPDPSKKDGLPYIAKDGEANPELEQYDRIPLHAMSNAVSVLSQAYYFSDNPRYAAKAVELLRVWFLDKKTHMKPNLNYSQFIPGLHDSKGTPPGLIDTYCFVDMLNSIKLLEGAEAYTANDKDGLKSWFSELADWMQNSESGQQERASDSNHGVAYDVQLTMYLLFSGRKEEGKQIINDFPERRLFVQIEPDGKLPRELRRADAFGYSVYNVRHMVEMSLIAQKEGILLWQRESEDKRSLHKAIEFLLPYLGKEMSDWPYRQLNNWDIKQRDFAEDLYRMTFLDPSRTEFIELYRKNDKKGADDRFKLLYGSPETIKTTHASTSRIKVKPTFESCSVYLPSDEKGAECTLFYKKKGESIWHKGFPPVYNEENKEFRGSLVWLEENTDYEVKAVLKNKGKTKEYIALFTTWNANPPIAQTIGISRFKESDSPGYAIKGIQGKEDGWIKIIGDRDVNAIDTDSIYAIKIEDSQYVILENMKIAGGRHGILVRGSSSQIRIQNCDISKWGRTSKNQSERGVYLDEENNKINFDGGVRIEYAEDIVVERCYIHDPKAKTNPWKGTIEDGPYAGKDYARTHPEGPCGIYVRQAVGGIVVRYNDIIGGQIHRFNDAIETAENGFKDGGFHRDSDIYGNVLAFGQDDAVELDGAQCNVRFYNNRIEQMLCGISTAPNMQGPSYIFNNVVWNLGDVTETESVSVKNGGGTTYSIGRQFFFHNTMVVAKNGMAGIGFGQDENREMFIATTRNNIFVSETESVITGNKGTGLPIYDIHLSPWNDFDYDMIGNSRTHDGAGKFLAHAEAEKNGIFAMPRFSDRKHAVFTLLEEDKGVDKGMVIPNFSDKYNGNAPDMGAFERGASSLFPIRPLPIEADKYFVQLKPGASETLTLTIGDLRQREKYTVHKCEDMSWLSVAPAKGEISPDSKTTISLEALDMATKYKKKGMIIIRLENGLSVPVTVFCE